MLDDAEIQRALVITAHPDDVDFGAAGTVATWTDSGVKVTYCVVTDGDAGGFDANVPREGIGRSGATSSVQPPPKPVCRTCTSSAIRTAGSSWASSSGATWRGSSARCGRSEWCARARSATWSASTPA